MLPEALYGGAEQSTAEQGDLGRAEWTDTEFLKGQQGAYCTFKQTSVLMHVCLNCSCNKSNMLKIQVSQCWLFQSQKITKICYVKVQGSSPASHLCLKPGS